MKVILTYELDVDDSMTLGRIQEIIDAGFNEIFDFNGVNALVYRKPKIDLGVEYDA